MCFKGTNEDLRSIKTEKALYSAMLSLLKAQSFKKTTVKEICEKALISRAAFYAHFIDKYDLLKQWLAEICFKYFDSGSTYEQLEQTVNSHMDDKRRIIKNLIYDADNETTSILFDFMISTKNRAAGKDCNKETHHRNVVLSSFYAGGIISYLLWQIKNEFPAEMPLMNKEVYQIIKEFQDR